MKKNEEIIKGRRALVVLAIENPSKAAEYIKQAAFTLEQCKTTTERIEVMSDLLFLSFSTIEKDIQNFEP